MKRAIVATLGLVLAATVVLMATRVGDQARFVTWPVVAVTALAAAVAVVGLRAALVRPSSLAIGLLPGLILAYLLPSLTPLWFLTIVLLLFGALAVNIGGPAAGMAAVTSIAVVALVLIQGPAVECSTHSISSNSGPWWIESSGDASGSGAFAGAGAPGTGTTRVGTHDYAYRCDGGELVSFERAG